MDRIQLQGAEMTNTGRQAANAANADLDAGDDAALIARSLHAPECFGVLFDRHAPAIGRYIARRLGPDAADDLVGMRFEGTALKEAVCEVAGRQAYRVELAGGAVQETAISTRLLA